jgi:hypothetical protein
MTAGIASAAGAAKVPGVTIKGSDMAPASLTATTGAPITIKLTEINQLPGFVATDITVATECNPAILLMDNTACNQNPLNIGQPGGPVIAKVNTTSWNGKATLLVQSAPTYTVGDNAAPCSIGGLCYIAVAQADPVTQTQGASFGLLPFGINPLG